MILLVTYQYLHFKGKDQSREYPKEDPNHVKIEPGLFSVGLL